MFLDGTLVYEIHPKPQHDYSINTEELAVWLTEAVDAAIKLLADGSYNTFVNDKLPFRKRLGKIYRKEYWRIFRDEKADYFDSIAEDEIQEFFAYIKGQPEDSPATRLPQMTSGYFFDCCKLGYAANQYRDANKLTARELYIANADGRDDGLLDLDEQSADAFAEWYHDRKNRGGHPWEVCRGGNATHISLYANHDDKGWYLSIAGSSYGRSVETIHFYSALVRQGIPVYLHDSKGIASRIAKEDYIGVVAEGTVPSYCHGLFPDEKILDFINLPHEETDRIITATKWYPLAQVRLLFPGGDAQV